jgi:SAM-dependent methyltransferase
LIHAIILPLLLFPLAYLSGTYGWRGAVLSLALSVAFLGDELVHAHHSVLAFEVFFVFFASGFGLVLGAAASRELRDEDDLRTQLFQQMERLIGEPGYWQEVAVTRMGLYVTRLERQFIDLAVGPSRPQTLVDVGAGRGRLEFVLLRNASHVIATEVNADDLAAMERHPSLSSIQVGPYPSLPFRAGSVDAIVALEVPVASDEHWFKSECARVLRSKGDVIVSVHNASSYKRLWSRLRAGSRRSQGLSWASLYYQKSLAQHMDDWRRAGFEVERSEGLYWAPFSRQSDSPWVSAVSIFERALGLRRLARWSPWVLLHLKRRSQT